MGDQVAAPEPTRYTLTASDLDEITDVDEAFSTTRFLPPLELIPEEFIAGNTKWNRLFSKWFYSGLTSLRVAAKDGIDTQKAVRCIASHMKSFEPRHEHKEAGVAYMMSLLFHDAEWE